MVVNDQEDYWLVPSNPWVAVRWREPDAIRVHLPPVMSRNGIGFCPAASVFRKLGVRPGASFR